MPITSISRDTPNNVSIVRITCTDTLADIAAANYITNQTATINELNRGTWQWFNSDVLLFDSADGNAFFVFTDDTFSSLVLLASSTDGTVSPGLMDQIAYYALSGTVVSGTNTLPSAVAIHPVNANNGTGAAANTFWAGNDTWKTVAAATSHSIYSVYVSPDGSNTTGNGSINAPYQTIVKALSTITTNDSTHIFNIILTGGYYNETLQIKLKPWVNLIGYDLNTIINNTLDIILDTSWDTATNGSISIESLSIKNNLQLDFSTVPLSDGPATYINNIQVNGSLLIEGNTVNPNVFFIRSSFFSTSVMNNATIESFNNYYFTSFTSGLTPFTTSTTYNSISDTYNSTVALFGSTVGLTTQTFNIKSSSLLGTLNVAGNNAVLNIDTDSYITPTILSFATVNLISIANGLNANYSPVNYIPDINGGTDPINSVAAHLHGIDNALSGSINSWTEVIGTSQAAAVRHGYIANNVGLVTITLPATATVGDIIAIQGKGAGGWRMAANAGQIVNVGNTPTSVAGSVSSTNQWDSIEIICVTNNTTFATKSAIGTFTIV